MIKHFAFKAGYRDYRWYKGPEGAEAFKRECKGVKWARWSYARPKDAELEASMLASNPVEISGLWRVKSVVEIEGSFQSIFRHLKAGCAVLVLAKECLVEPEKNHLGTVAP